MCRDQWMFLFETVHGLFLSGSVMFSLTFLWGLISGVFLSPTTERSRKLDPILRLHFNRTTKETAYTLVEYWDIETGAFVPSTWIALALIAAITATCFGCIFYCGYYTYAMMTSHQLHLSRQLKLLQKQLFRSLIVLTMLKRLTNTLMENRVNQKARKATLTRANPMRKQRNQ
ncbi:unnamed protein product, partial [Mesorhabditis belari]|uniref:Uncharacterized protein n=1 Tax=Mesorhabditis belari TaxID=2138241 RepID=A0AAF3FA17_9BILA